MGLQEIYTIQKYLDKFRYLLLKNPLDASFMLHSFSFSINVRYGSLGDKVR